MDLGNFMDSSSYGTIGDLNATEDNSSYRMSVAMDEDITLHSLSIPEYPVRFESLSLWLDSSDPQGGSFSFKSENELMLWLDASDASTITKVEGTDEMESWSNKVNPAVEMKSWNHKPTFINSHLSGRTGLKIYSENGQRQGFTAYQNGGRWNPAGENGAASGAVRDVTIMLLWRVDQFTRTTFLFNMGWETISHGTTVIFIGDFRTTVKVSGLDRVEFQSLRPWNFRSPKVNESFSQWKKGSFGPP